MAKFKLSNLKPGAFFVLDGATGTELQKMGMPDGESPESWGLKNPEKLSEIHSAYLEAGSDIVYSCTFGGNPFKLAEFGMDKDCRKINCELAKIAKKALGGKGFVAGDIGPSGLFVEPFGQLPFEDAVSGFKKQIRGLEDGGADLLVIETMMDIQEARAALIAAKEATSLPVVVSMTFSDDGRTLTGSDPLAALVTLQSLGADAVGCNCSLGPEAILAMIIEMSRHSKVPLFAKPNAGLPKLVDGKTVFDMSPDEFADFAPKFLEAGVAMLGGCCGTTPDFIRAIRRSLSSCKVSSKARSECRESSLSSPRKALFFTAGKPTLVVGERINPSGKQIMKDELKEGKFMELRRLAIEQKEAGADILDVNVGAPGADEKKNLPEAVKILSSLVDLPLCLDSSDIEALEKALRIYPGRALINSVSFESVKINKLLPAAAKYGAMFVLLPLGDDEIPMEAETRKSYVKKVFKAAARHNYSPEDFLVDGLVMTVSSNRMAAVETLKLIEWASENSYGSIVGLSNVSFGLPERKWINSSFLAMAVSRGLTCAILNPSSEEMLSMRMASDVLAGRDPNCKNYVQKFQQGKGEAPRKSDASKLLGTPEEQLYEAVLKGNKDAIQDLVRRALDSGTEASVIVDKTLIPAINQVGDLFDKKQYYLPQLIMSAEAMKAAFDLLEPLLMKGLAGSGAAKQKTKVILATVKGDIHDIGKNIVALMLKNYGFEVIDLGKDVSSEKILASLVESGAELVGLSALMTTTMGVMGEIISTCRNGGFPKVKFMVGGAVLDQSYADQIGADGYAPDSVEAVKLAKKLSGLA